MITFSILISNSQIKGPGGLFDLNATLPLVIIQFILTAIILNPILFKPLVSIINKRDNYISVTIDKASKLLIEADILTAESEITLMDYKEDIQLEISESQEINKKVFNIMLKKSQNYIDSLLSKISDDLVVKKTFAINQSNEIVKSLAFDLGKRIFNDY